MIVTEFEIKVSILIHNLWLVLRKNQIWLLIWFKWSEPVKVEFDIEAFFRENLDA